MGSIIDDGLTGSVMEAYFQVNVETGEIKRIYRSRCGVRFCDAGYIKSGTSYDGGGYKIISIPKGATRRAKKVQAHRLIWMWAYGEWPESGKKWVYLNKKNGKWRAEIASPKSWGAGRKRIHYSEHLTKAGAHAEACAAAMVAFGEWYNPG